MASGKDKSCKTYKLDELYDIIGKITREKDTMNTNVPSEHSKSYNHPSSSRSLSHSSANPHNAKTYKEIEYIKRTRRKPRIIKSKGNLDSALDYNSGTSLLPFKNKTIAQTSIPSISRNESTDKEKSINRKNVTINNLPEIQYNFIIEAATNYKTGQFIRRRNSKHKYINLKSFINTDVKSYVFTTHLLSANKLGHTLNNLSINDKQSAKSECRKFAQNLQPSNSSRIKKKKKEKKVKEDTASFQDYISVDEVAMGLSDGSLIKGFVRINPKNYRDSYVNNEDSSQADYYVTTVIDRNRALEGDEVILRIKPEQDWIEGRKTARVVFIKQMVHPRITVGGLKPFEKKNDKYAALYPRDKRIPIIRIPASNWPNGFKSNPKQFENILFVAKIIEWQVPTYAHGLLIENLGISGDLKVETMSILREFCLDITQFPPEVLEYLPKSKEIPQKEFQYREDIRKECIFTVDPATARDLDDAVSAKMLLNGNYEIGVHISDASFYLEEGTILDQIVSKKATTIYLVDNTYHMLPVGLCLFCSLLPGVDKLTFSVIWEMTEEGEIINKRFTRSIVNSCAQLAYEHAQMIIENPTKEFKDEDFPSIYNDFKAKDLVKTVNILQKIAVKLRERREQNGALKIDQVKLLFNLDPLSGEPLDFWKYENKKSHQLIEEFMLLANISVAERILEGFPHIAFLRRHEPPKQTMLTDLQNNLATCGIHIDITSSGGISTSLKKYINNDYAGQCRGAVLNHLLAKPMTKAEYFCASTKESKLDHKHYALSVPIYTHFTSPIRRYADIMVHRLLSACLGYSEHPLWDVDYVTAIAANCNIQKYNAKRAGEASAELHLAYYIEKYQPYEQDCVVVDVREKSFDAIVMKTGSIVRIYQNNCEDGTLWKTENVPTLKSDENLQSNSEDDKILKEFEKKLLKLTITFPKTDCFPETPLIVEIFTVVKVNLKKKQNSYKLEGTLLRPIPVQIFSKR